MPYSANFLISLVRGDCQRPSHHAGGRSGVKAHWLGWLWHPRGPANLFHTCPQPIWNLKPSLNKSPWKLLKNAKLEPVGLSPAKDRMEWTLQHFEVWATFVKGNYPNTICMYVPRLFAAASAAINCALVVPTRPWALDTTAYFARDARKKSTKATHLGAGPQSFILKSKLCNPFLLSDIFPLKSS